MTDNAITRASLAEQLHQKLGYSKSESEEFISTVLDHLAQGIITHGQAKISGFGTFKVLQKKQRIGRNPKTMQEATIPARQVVTFHPSPILKQALNDND